MKERATAFLFLAIAAFCVTPWSSPPLALVLGVAFALSLGNPFPTQSKVTGKILLQSAVVLLGFSMDLRLVLKAGKEGLVFALLSIILVFGLGWALKKLLSVRPVTSLLVSTGTAICGGSAIAAMSSVVNAPQEDVSVSVGTVFLLNAVALLIFPSIGHFLKLSPEDFGTWSGIAIHDVSSVVGAASTYGGNALSVATAVKLSRVLYLIPITLIATVLVHRSNAGKEESEKAQVQIPWFVGLFLLASFARSYLPAVQARAADIKVIASSCFALCLFLIGAGLTVATLKKVGFRPLLQGVLLWIFIGAISLFAVKSTSASH